MLSDEDGKLLRRVTRRDDFSSSGVSTAVVFRWRDRFNFVAAEKSVWLSSSNEITN